MKYENFKKSILEAVDKFRAVDKKERIKVVSHLDADGLCACSILIKALNEENRRYSISIVQQLNEKILKELKNESYNCYIFTDLGSGQIKNIKEKLNGKTVFVLDHHKPESAKDDNIIHVNPHLFGIDGSKEISGAGVVYLFTKALNTKHDMSHIAVIGAIGDVQEKNGFLKLNNEILETAVKNKKIKIKKGLRFFGSQTKPLHKVLEYSTDPYIPSVTGSESGAIQFLHQIGIEPKKGDDWRKVIHLNNEEMKKLVTGIIMKRLDEENPDDVLGNVYTLPEEEEESPLRDAKEFSTLLNACGRLGKASLGIGVCLNDKKAKQRAINNLEHYKREIITAMRWYEENKNSKDIIHEKGLVIINSKENFLSTMAGTVASLLARSKAVEKGTFILSMARNSIEGTTKVSLRRANKDDVDLKRLIDKIIAEIDGAEAGGHASAAGAVIPTEKEQELIKEAKRVLRNEVMEEKVE